MNGFRLVDDGPLAIPTVQPCLATGDALRRFSGLLVGMEPVTRRTLWEIFARTNTNGNQQLLGGSVFREANRQRIVDWVINNIGSNSRTVSLGNVSGGTQYLNGGAAAVGPTDVTLAARIAATQNLWANSNGTDELVHTITGHRIGA